MDTSYGITILYKDKILLCHPTNARWWGTYTIPKGHSDEGESPKKAAIRETFEEIGIKIPKKWLSNPYELFYITKKKRLYYWVIRITDLKEIGLDSEVVPKSQLQAKEISWAGFVDKEDAKKRIMINQQPLLKHLTEKTHSKPKKIKVFESFKDLY